jgi:hypothetical protein
VRLMPPARSTRQGAAVLGEWQMGREEGLEITVAETRLREAKRK